MTYAQIQRRAFVVALFTLAVAMAIALGYWQGVRKGALPSPVQPLRQDHPRAVSVRALARSAPPSRPTPEAPPAPPSQMSQPGSGLQSPIIPAKLESRPNAASRVAAAPRPAATNDSLASEVKTAAPKVVTPLGLTAAKPELHSETPVVAPLPLDLERAHAWLSNTNRRPVIRVHYELVDLLQLAKAGRGLILASSTDSAETRSLYLQPASGGAPLFAPCTENLARQYANYRLLLAPSLRLAQWTEALPLYFPKDSDAVEMSFIPDVALATAIFAEVAKGDRTADRASTRNASLRAEGRLIIEGGQPRFELMAIDRAP